MNWLDSLIGFISPTVGARRARARLAGEYFSKQLSVRKFEAASVGRRTDGWITPSTNANTETKGVLFRLRDRSRDLTRNNPIAARALQVIVSNTVGTGIVAQHKAPSPEGAALWGGLWDAFALNCDTDGRMDFYGLQSLVMRTLVESGEVLVRKVPQASNAGLLVPLKIQVLEPDFLDSSKDGPTQTGQIVQGVEFDRSGKRTGYWLFPAHPGAGGGSMSSQRVSADEILHIFRLDRAGQARGVPWCAPVVVRLKDLDDYLDSQLVKLKTSCAFTAFVYDTEAPMDGASAAKAIGEKLEPGVIEILPPGKDIKFATPPGADGSGDFVAEMLRQIASAFGITYESLGDYSRVNYSSGRMGWLEMSRNVQVWQWQILVTQFCAPVWGWFRDAAALVGANPDGASVEWTPPRREMIDPSKEIGATVTAIRAGLMSISEAHRSAGYDSAKVLDEIAADNAKIDALGLVLDSDARKTMKAGATQVPLEDSSGG